MNGAREEPSRRRDSSTGRASPTKFVCLRRSLASARDRAVPRCRFENFGRRLLRSGPRRSRGGAPNRCFGRLAPMTTAQRGTLAAAILGSAIVFLDGTLVYIALPRIGEQLPSTILGKLEGQTY